MKKSLSSACLVWLLRFAVPTEALRRPIRTSVAMGISRGGSSYPDSSSYPMDDGVTFPHDQESVQDRVNAWKRQQMESYNQMREEDIPNIRDSQGRLNLLTSVGKGSRALIFFILMWRDVHLFETADQALRGMTRLCVVTTVMLLFFANLAGVVASITSPSSSAKKRLKAILNLDKLVEGMMIVFNFARLTVFPSKYTPREIYIANTLHSVFFILQSQAFTRLTWGEFTEPKAAVGGTTMSRPSDPVYEYSGATDGYQEEQAHYQQQQPTGYGRGTGTQQNF